MYKHLYDKFAHWYRGGSIYFYSDPHFNDEEMKYLRHNYIGDDAQVASINRKIGKCDTIVFLGDIGDVEYIKKIRGYKVLVMGNHDAGASNYQSIFDEVYEGPLFISEKILLSHEPIGLPFALNIHGHDHSNWVNFVQGKGFNMCAEHINYTPVGIKSIVESGVLKKVDSIHRITIDNATERSRKR